MGIAARRRALIPHVMEKATLRTGPRTEKIPLIPHAQGTKGAAVSFNCSRAQGTNIPRQTPIGRIRAEIIAALSEKDRPIRQDSRGNSILYSTSMIAARI